MPDENDDLDLDDLDDNDQLDIESRLNNLHKQIRLEKKQNKDLKSQLADGESAKRKLALMDAKLPDTPQVRYFLDHYDGDFTPEEIRSKAAEFGFIEPDRQTQDEVNQVEAMMQASSGATFTAPGTDAAMMDEINAATGSQQIAAIMRKYGKYQDDEE
jgi:hypothetical protein